MKFRDTSIGLPAALGSLRPLPSGPDLEPVLPAFRVAPGVEPQLRRLRTPGALAVTTGQQPGLFLGPLYTIHKAISAAALAAELEARWDRPVVPVFWLAGDDHDYAEARTAAWIGTDGALVRQALADRAPDAPLTPMYRLTMDQSVAAATQAFRGSFAETPFLEAAAAWLERHYAPGRTVAQAFGDALAELLAPFGVLCFDSTHAAAKQAMAAGLVAALEAAPALEEGLTAQAHDLDLAGDGGAPAGLAPGATLVFLEDAAGRDRLMQDGDAFVTRRGGQRFTLGDLRALAADSPERLSPNVLLRPVLERLLLPTLAYAAGPGELSYLPLARPIYHRLGVSPQCPVPRWSGILIEPRVERTLKKFEASLDELLDDQALEHRVLRSQLPSDFVEPIGALHAAIERAFPRLRQGAGAIDPTLAGPVEQARRHLETRLAELERKVERHLRRREATELAQIARARTAVLPGGLPQERVLSIAGFLARYGPAVLEGLAAHIRAWYAETLVAEAAPA